ncbi:hypothetical protein Ccrd_020011 [Cynara cardunculus var. scolymus]|uniref:Uncharacterized protein n=1 Tax=Cynara cardunculus var. scolymus TaxID=59895 RepID=A0A118K0P7_CYNCS|nr:hypothetical protein Ccrd_020011 [Cynara cardunculus var. scolymus]
MGKGGKSGIVEAPTPPNNIFFIQSPLSNTIDDVANVVHATPMIQGSKNGGSETRDFIYRVRRRDAGDGCNA